MNRNLTSTSWPLTSVVKNLQIFKGGRNARVVVLDAAINVSGTGEAISEELLLHYPDYVKRTISELNNPTVRNTVSVWRNVVLDFYFQVVAVEQVEAVLDQAISFKVNVINKEERIDNSRSVKKDVDPLMDLVLLNTEIGIEEDNHKDVKIIFEPASKGRVACSSVSWPFDKIKGVFFFPEVRTVRSFLKIKAKSIKNDEVPIPENFFT